MNVFISWSGCISKEIALALKEWLPRVIQAIKPWMSDEDIDKGARWSVDVAKQLNATKVGIICVTPDNYSAPWLNFEAGAISNVVGESYVCPYIFNMKKTDLQGPLTQFQITTRDKEDTKKLISTLNKALGDNRLQQQLIDDIFEKWWPDFSTKQDNIPIRKPVTEPKRSDSELLEEILELVRQLNRESPRVGSDWLSNALAAVPYAWTGSTKFIETKKESETVELGICRTKDGKEYHCLFFPAKNKAEAIGPLLGPDQIGSCGVAFKVHAVSKEEAKKKLADAIGQGEFG